MSAELLGRADSLRAHYRTLESVPGSGYHDNDRDPNHPGRFLAPQKNGLPAASEHAVAFFDHWAEEEVHFVGPDAAKVHAALSSQIAKIAQAMADAEARGQDPWATLSGHQRKLRTIFPKLAVKDVEGVPRLTTRLSYWNDVLEAVRDEGLGVSGAPLVPDGSTP